MKKYCLKVAPENWERRTNCILEMSGEETLEILAKEIAAFFHIHEQPFEFCDCREGKSYSDHIFDFDEDTILVTDTTLDSLNPEKGQYFTLVYAFEDDWSFDIQIQEITEMQA